MSELERAPAAEFYKVDGTYFAFGLHWMTAASSKQSIANAKTASKRQGASHVAWRLHKTQVGYARCDNDNVPKGFLLNPWRSAASAFADLPHSSLLAAFTFTNGKFWIFASHEGRIYPDGDIMFDDEDEAKAHFDVLFGKTYYNDIYGPASWHSRAKPLDPLQVLRRRRPDGKVFQLLDGLMATAGLAARPGTPVRPLTFDAGLDKKSGLLLGGIVVSLGVVAFIGYSKWHAAHQPRVMAAPPPFYPTIMSARSVLAACLPALPTALLDYQTPGWAIASNICDARQITVTLAANSATPISSLRAFQPGAELVDPRTAIVSVNLADEVSKEAISLPLITDERLRAIFMVINDRANSTNTLPKATAPSDPAPLANGRQRPRPYLTTQWTFSTTAPPEMWAPDLAAIPNLELTSVELNRADHGMTWNIKGNAYVQR